MCNKQVEAFLCFQPGQREENVSMETFMYGDCVFQGTPPVLSIEETNNRQEKLPPQQSSSAMGEWQLETGN